MLATMVRLLTEAGVEVAGESEDADGLLADVGSTNPDVAAVDIRMPPTNTDEGVDAAQRIRADHPETGVLVLSHYVEPGVSEFAHLGVTCSAVGGGLNARSQGGPGRRGRGRLDRSRWP